ncbi:hypothetical protein AOL_s00088g2 [Orbilia oligospora ATCC 24927]|uniref:DNA/RNA-binding domain-containing protein n=1 Tax=Arthrobotrys oligospora (strain ATCC 24927 / CBS 115.81 / DSM 1491) TaxID=756982 RepID=G1XHN9_ARTOA|nr:hypothetical protein AOL_s00088g2 [Orbilia oligospora ATCC 24927]EGX47287.1 hypothetical protein AOL_s00088g2 [Orbilia oligospora ATCC 24927]
MSYLRDSESNQAASAHTLSTPVSSDTNQQIWTDEQILATLPLNIRQTYDEIVLVETKLRDVCKKLFERKTKPQFQQETLQAFSKLCLAFVGCFYNFFHSSQTPIAPQAIRDLPRKYNMCERFQYGVSISFELLEYVLPCCPLDSQTWDNSDSTYSFFIDVYSQVTMLYEAVPAFRCFWTHILGDLALHCYRARSWSGKERDSLGFWGGKAREWYGEAIRLQPGTDNTYRLLGRVLSKDPLRKMSCYYMARSSISSFELAEDVLMDLNAEYRRYLTPENNLEQKFVLLHAFLDTASLSGIESQKTAFLQEIKKEVEGMGYRFELLGAHMAVCGIASILFHKSELDSQRRARDIAFGILCTLLTICADQPAVGPHIYIWLIFLNSTARWPQGNFEEEGECLFQQLKNLASRLLREDSDEEHITTATSMEALFEDQGNSPLPEEYLIRHWNFTSRFFPEGYFSNHLASKVENPSQTCNLRYIRQRKILILLRSILTKY